MMTLTESVSLFFRRIEKNLNSIKVDNLTTDRCYSVHHDLKRMMIRINEHRNYLILLNHGIAYDQTLNQLFCQLLASIQEVSLEVISIFKDDVGFDLQDRIDAIIGIIDKITSFIYDHYS